MNIATSIIPDGQRVIAQVQLADNSKIEIFAKVISTLKVAPSKSIIKRRSQLFYLVKSDESGIEYVVDCRLVRITNKKLKILR